jgi:dTDP-4-amino-4,6-dideoxygalactose transaminase
MHRKNDRLAIDGGEKIRQRVFAPWPLYDAEEIAAASAVLKSGKVNYWTGNQGRLFEEEFAAASESKHAVAVANGTVALELALQALEIGVGDEVIVPSRSFVASASSVVMRNATPVFADISEESQTVTGETIEAVVTKRSKAIIAVHLAGWPCKMDGILCVAKRYNLKVIEDCAQAQGARYLGRPVGSFGDAAAFSFCQDKIMSTGGEGGMLVTSNEEVWRKAWSFKDHGKDVDSARDSPPSEKFQWLHESVGTNWRLTEMQSAIGRGLLSKLKKYIAKRRRNAGYLNNLLGTLPALRLTIPLEETFHSYYKYYAFVRPERIRKGWDRDRVLSALRAEGIPCFSGSCSELYLEKAFMRTLRPIKRLAVARHLGETSLMFLVHPTLGDEEMNDVYRALKQILVIASV